LSKKNLRKRKHEIKNEPLFSAELDNFPYSENHKNIIGEFLSIIKPKKESIKKLSHMSWVSGGKS